MESARGWIASTHQSLSEVPAAEWDTLANADGAANPFVTHAYLSALEEAGCVAARTGWHPAHQAVRDQTGALIAAAPCYVKSHSMGEYVFDQSWAEALTRAGGHYYPKLQVSVPFTPVTGPRLLLRPDTRTEGTAGLCAAFEALRSRIEASSIHATFLPQNEVQALEQQGYLLRTDRQFHWVNEGYRDFDDFLAALSSRKRKMIRRERKDALSADIEIRWITGNDITEADWDAFFAFYMDTGSRKWGKPYLNRRFFSLIGERMADRILLVFACRAGRPIAGAINFIGRDALFGRNWGAIEEHPFLHFEVCYYQAIDFALARKLGTVEAGAQGEHKLMRGYRPVTTHSAHAIAHEGLRRAVAAYLLREQDHIAHEKIALDRSGPFRRT